MQMNAKTGKLEPRWWRGAILRGCGPVSGSQNMLFHRSGCSVSYDLASGATARFPGFHPGCWVNTIPAGGVVIQPDATSGCICNYAIQATVVLKPSVRSR